MNPPPIPTQQSDPNLGSKLLGFFGALAFCAMVLWLLIGGFSTPTARDYGAATRPEPAAVNVGYVVPRASLLETSRPYDDATSSYLITGLVTNNTSEPIRWISVNYSILDSGGAKIGNASDHLADLGAHEAWRFKARIFEKDAAQYRFEGLTVK